MDQITKAQEILDIISPIPADKFITGKFGYWDNPENGQSCFIGHINRALNPDGSPFGNHQGFGARQLTQKFLGEVHNLWDCDGADVNNEDFINGYNEPEIKDRIMHLLNDMVKAGY